MTDPAVAVSPDKVAVWEDFVDILHAPSTVFARRRGAGFWTPLLIIAVVASILSFSTARILEPALDADTRRQTHAMQQDNPDMDAAAGVRMMESAGDFLALAGGLFIAIAVLVQGLFLWVGGKLAGSSINGRSALVVATYATVPTLIGGIVMIIEGLLRGPSTLDGLARLSWSPARFMDPDGNWSLAKFLAELDLFTIWWAVLLAIGLAVIGNMSRARAAGVVGAIWLVTSIPALAAILFG